MYLMERILKAEVDNLIVSDRVTKVATMENPTMAEDWLTTAAPAELPTHH
jgi:hypothetical protein